MGKEFDKYSAEAADVKISDYHNRLFIQFLEKEINAEDIAAILNNKEEHEFWEDFRLRYQEFGDDADLMLEDLRAKAEHKPKATGDRTDNIRGERDTGTGRPAPGLPQQVQPKPSLPEPEVPRDRRRGSNAPRGGNPIVRAIGSIRRRIFRRNQ